MGEEHGHAHSHEEHTHAHEQAKHGTAVLYGLIALLVAVMAYNQSVLGDVSSQMATLSVVISTRAAAPVGNAPPSPALGGQGTAGSSASLEAIAAIVIPSGTPKTYGSELKVSYDQVVQSLPILAKLDDSISLESLGTQGKDRYIKIGLQISCEYCCGAESIIFKNGQAACGCQHSYAMRGLAKYLLKNHASEYTDDQILEEMGKWKTLFFPKQILQKAVEFQSAGKALNTIDLTSNKFRGFKAASSGASAAAGGSVGNLPDMVGGC